MAPCSNVKDSERTSGLPNASESLTCRKRHSLRLRLHMGAQVFGTRGARWKGSVHDASGAPVDAVVWKSPEPGRRGEGAQSPMQMFWESALPLPLPTVAQAGTLLWLGDSTLRIAGRVLCQSANAREELVYPCWSQQGNLALNPSQDGRSKKRGLCYRCFLPSGDPLLHFIWLGNMHPGKLSAAHLEDLKTMVRAGVATFGPAAGPRFVGFKFGLWETWSSNCRTCSQAPQPTSV